MADKARRVPENVSGDFFVDSTCIGCDQCRAIAPETFEDAGGHASVYHQPDSLQALRRALLALLTCPVGSIGAESHHPVGEAVAAFPERIEDNVYFCGFASSASYGASSYLIVRPEGNLLVDSPRFASRLVERIEGMGGLQWMFLTHEDDVADQERFHRRFGCERILHRRDAHQGLAGVERPIEGEEPQGIGPELLAIPTPGHTRGHMVLLYRERFLFSGDHL